MYSIKKLKTFASPDGGGFNATLCLGKTQVADLHDGGYGGCIDFTWLDSARNGKVNENPTFEKEFNWFLSTIKVPGITYNAKRGEFEKNSDLEPLGAEWYVHFLIEDTQIKKDLRSLLRRKIVGYVPKEKALCEWIVKPEFRDEEMFDLFRKNQGVEYFLNSEAGVEFDDALHLFKRWVTKDYGTTGTTEHFCWDHAEHFCADSPLSTPYTVCVECGRVLAMG